jgi:hypothetical protein
MLALTRTGATALLAAALAPMGCHSQAAHEVQEDVLACQGLRWPVKTGSDHDAAQVNLTPVDTTIAELVALPAPTLAPEDSRVAPTELTTFRLTNVTVTSQNVAGDLDANLLITDGTNRMITEIPSPQCVDAGSPFLAGITAARQVFDARFPQGSPADVNLTATITGVAFFDFPHGQEGRAPNSIELHPVLSLCFGDNCTPAP